jgi:MFS family permease
MVGVGFAWASILSLPYAMLSDSVPAAKMGVYMGIFNFFIVIPQLVAVSQPARKLFLLKMLGGACFLVAASRVNWCARGAMRSGVRASRRDEDPVPACASCWCAIPTASHNFGGDRCRFSRRWT